MSDLYSKLDRLYEKLDLSTLDNLGMTIDELLKQIADVGMSYSSKPKNLKARKASTLIRLRICVFTQLKWLKKQLKFTGSRNKKQLKSLIPNRRKIPCAPDFITSW